MQDPVFLEYVSHYRDAKPRGSKRFLIWGSLAIHALVLVAVLVVPLMEVGDGDDLPEVSSIAAFMVRPQAPPPPPPPPPPLPPRAAAPASAQQARPRPPATSSLVAPVEIPESISVEDIGFAGGDYAIGGVEGGIPGGVVGGIVGGLADMPVDAARQEEPVRLDFRSAEARPLVRVEPKYPDLAAQAHVQGVVILEVLVDPAGAPSKIKVLRTVDLLEAAAIEAVEAWRWSPYEVAGKAVPFRVTVTVNFRLT